MVSFNFLNWPMIFVICHSFLDEFAAFGFDAVWRVDIALNNNRHCAHHSNRVTVAPVKLHSIGFLLHFYYMLNEHTVYDRT